MKQVAIIDAVRTPIGSIGGTLKNISPEELGRSVVQGLLDRTGISVTCVDEVIFGHCRQSADNPDIARIIALLCRIPDEVPAYTVMRHCASGMTAIHNAALSILQGENQVVIAGGVESMSTAPFYIRNARFGLGTGNAQLLDSLVETHYKAQPEEIYGHFNMGETAERIADSMHISREDQDIFALGSQQKAKAAISSGYFRDEIIPVSVPQKKTAPIRFDTDEFPKESTIEKLSALKPVFRDHGTVTAGNSSGRNDGASALLLMELETATKLGLKPMATIVSHGVVGVDPRVMGLGPIKATEKALERAGLTLADMDLIELNEAFAAQAIGCVRALGIPEERLNVNGGAIALGHPVGASGARIVVTLLHALRRKGLQYGLATLCAGGGMGEALVLKAFPS